MRVKAGADWEPDREALLAGLREFARTMKRAPFRNRFGLRGVSAFALYWFLRRVQPTIVFEVGVWRGFSTWLIEQAAPQAELHCLDPIFALESWLSRWKIGARYRSPHAHYSMQDFSCADIAKLAAGRERPLAFFDDHQNKLPRLLQCRAAGIRDIVFDDNMVRPGTHRSLEDERLDAESRAVLEREVEAYEIFPALWDVDFHESGLDISEKGLGFPVDDELRALHGERKWHSFVTYVRLR
ncbi:MAG TPA: hypothetical protein VF702_08035 [Allosphingosinicella sp.]|jgi:hypothetical protein